jgi:hypothetical protein
MSRYGAILKGLQTLNQGLRNIENALADLHQAIRQHEA